MPCSPSGQIMSQSCGQLSSGPWCRKPAQAMLCQDCAAYSCSESMHEPVQLMCAGAEVTMLRSDGGAVMCSSSCLAAAHHITNNTEEQDHRRNCPGSAKPAALLGSHFCIERRSNSFDTAPQDLAKR